MPSAASSASTTSATATTSPECAPSWRETSARARRVVAPSRGAARDRGRERLDRLWAVDRLDPAERRERVVRVVRARPRARVAVGAMSQP
jgi:hypothetical protein